MTPGSTPKIANADGGVRHVFIKNLVLDSLIGIYDFEKAKTQRVRISVDLAVRETSQPIEDNIENVTSYEQLTIGIKDIVNSGHINLVETLAESIAELGLKSSNTISVRVRVEKLDIVPEAESVGVEIERHNQID